MEEERKCKKCGTTKGVYFDGMCRQCYEDSIQITSEELKTDTQKTQSTNEYPIYKKWWFWAILAIVIIIISTNGKSNNDNNVSTSGESISYKNEITENKTYKNSSKNNNTNVYNSSTTTNTQNNISENNTTSITTNNNINNNSNSSFSTEKVTMGQKNALTEAKAYLNTMAFSYKGLIEQLEYEGYTNEEATYGADNCGADWNEQASKMAKEYINTMSFSKNALIEQLEYSGFTKEQATYGVSAVGY